MTTVHLDHVRKVYPSGVQAVRDVSLSISSGEFLVLVGPSGSGKTTLLRLIAGLERPTGGQVRMGDRIVTDLAPHARDVALVFQRPVVYPHLTVRRNLAFGVELRNGNVPDLENRILEAAQLLGLAEVLERQADQLSGGQQQRVALGRAVVRRPAVFLLDEPLGQLDAPLRAGLRRQLHLLHRQRVATMIYVTHDPVEAMVLADRVAVLDQGTLQQVDTPQAVYDRPANRRVAGFFGWPAMNLLDGRLEAAENDLGLRTIFGRWPISGPISDLALLAGRDVTVGIRPEHLVVGSAEGLPMETILVEPLGDDILLTLRRVELELTARAPRNVVWRPGETVNVMIPMAHAHLFERTTGQAIRRGAASG